MGKIPNPEPQDIVYWKARMEAFDDVFKIMKDEYYGQMELLK